MLVAPLAVALSACTANLEMEIGDDGRYSAVVEIRDSTGEVLPSGERCQEMADEAVLGTSASSQAEVLEADGDDVACRITVTGAQIPASDQAAPDALVVREDDLYVVDLTMLTDGLTAPTGTALPEGAAAPSGSGDPQGLQGPAPTGAGVGPTTPPLESRISVTFPGAVVDGGGGSVDGRTVTWEDTDALIAGIRATGYARANAGLGFWDRYSWWVIGATSALAAAVATAAIRRRRARG